MRISAARRCICILVYGGMQALLVHPLHAAEWSMNPSVSLRTEYNDNIQLTTEPHPTVWGVTLSPDVRFTGATETVTVIGGLNMSVNWFNDQPDLNAFNYALTLRSTYRASERDLLRLNIDSVRDPTLVSELATTGVVLAYEQRDRLYISPSWSRALTESTSIVATYGYTSVDYDGTGSGLIDYHNQGMSIALQSNITERQFAVLTAYYDLYETNPSNYKAETYGVQAGYTYSFSEAIHGSLSAGLRDTRSTFTSSTFTCNGFIFAGACLGTISQVTTTTTDSTAGWTLDASIEKRTETSTLGAQLSRQIYPSGQGKLIQTDRLALTWSQQWTPTLNTALLAAIYQTRNAGVVQENNDGLYYSVEPRFSWRLDEQWTLDASFRHARQTYDNSPAAATGNAVYATLRYVWPRLGVSR